MRSEKFPRHLWLISYTAHVAPLPFLVSLGLFFFAAYALTGVSAFVLTCATALVLLLLVIAEFKHEIQRCTRCASTKSLNGANQAWLVRAFLWAAHWPRWFLWTMVGISFVLFIAYFGGLHSWIWHTAFVVVAWEGQGQLVHRVHRRWCPHCRDRDTGGDPEVTPEPTLPEPSRGPA